MVQLLLVHDQFLDEVLDSTKIPDSSQTSPAPASSWATHQSPCSMLHWLVPFTTLSGCCFPCMMWKTC